MVQVTEVARVTVQAMQQDHEVLRCWGRHVAC